MLSALVLWLYVSCVRGQLQQLSLEDAAPCAVGAKNGSCVRLYSCPSAAAYRAHRNAGHLNGIRSLAEPRACAPTGAASASASPGQAAEPLVCCTDCWLDHSEKSKHEVLMEYGLPYKKEGPKAWTKCQEFFRELPYACHGVAGEVSTVWDRARRCDVLLKQSLGIGGQFALRGQYPHMALLGYGGGGGVSAAQWVCGGAVISERFILTAAHCTSSPLLGNVSFAGLGILTRSELDNFWKVYKIKRTIPHPDYRSPAKYHDIALLETDTEINFGKELLPACLDVGKVSRARSSAPGWGRLGHRRGLAEHLMVMELDEYSSAECSALFPPHRLLQDGYDHGSQMCYGRRDEVVDTCEGDSGGPLQVYVSGCLNYVVGVTSYGKNCGIPGNAGMYTRVAHYLPWIESVVWPDA